MKLNNISFDEAKNSIQSYSYVLAYEYSRLVFDKAANADINWEECTEAYIFSETSQIHIFKSDDCFNAVKCEEEENDHYSDISYQLAQKFSAFGQSFTVRNYFTEDEDGQKSVAYQRIVSVEE